MIDFIDFIPKRIKDFAASYFTRTSSSFNKRSLRAKRTMASPHLSAPKCLAASILSSALVLVRLLWTMPYNTENT